MVLSLGIFLHYTISHICSSRDILYLQASFAKGIYWTRGMETISCAYSIVNMILIHRLNQP